MTAHTYVTQIVKKVKCSGKRRKEIYRQLMADINEETENGVSLDVIMYRMGEPIAIAWEFNQNLSETERKRYKRSDFKMCIGDYNSISSNNFFGSMVSADGSGVWQQRIIYAGNCGNAKQGNYPIIERGGL